ncbi:delta-60 repeat domain-containing protein [Pseudomonas sp. S8]|uniref:delta-60 repeat domain-containing protein n=1 Tax=Pseudomonas sp. S8 TaxID=211136 RepID=UPI003D269C11
MNTESSRPKKPGDLDTGFGTNGIIFGPTNAVTYCVVDQLDGNLVYAVHTQNSYHIHRIFPDGQPDTSFGNEGMVIGQFKENQNSEPVRLVARDKKITIFGDALTGAEGTPAAKRLNENGSPDLVFQPVLVPRPAISSNGDPSDGGVLEDGRILILSQRTKDNLMHDKGQLTCFHADGSLDTSFGDQGHININWGNDINRMVSIAIQPDDKIVVGANYVKLPAGSRIVLTRYLSNGKLDKTFGDDGLVSLGPEGGSYDLKKLIALPDGKLLCAGRIGNYQALIMRFETDGRPDPTFNGGKEVLIEVASYNGTLSAVAVQPEDGKIIAAGWDVSSPLQMFWGRLNEDGSFDTRFGNNGWSRGLTGIPYDIVMQPERFIIAGQSSTPSNSVLYGIQR